MRGLAANETFEHAIWQRDTWTGSSTPMLVEEAVLPKFLMPEGVRARCAAPGCQAQVKFWKRTGRPVFEGEWACSEACVRSLVLAAVNRQLKSVTLVKEEPGTHRHRIPLGLVLLDRGVVTQFQLRQALDAQKSAGHGRIGHWLEETCGISAEKITRAMAAQWNRPMLSTHGFSSERMATVMPMALRKEAGMLPLRVAANKILYVAFVDTVDVAAVGALEQMSGLSVESGLLPHDEFAAAEASLGVEEAAAMYEVKIADKDKLCDRVVDALYEEQPLASRLVRVRGGWWLRMWLERGVCGRQGTLPVSCEDVVDVLLRP